MKEDQTGSCFTSTRQADAGNRCLPDKHMQEQNLSIYGAGICQDLALVQLLQLS